MYEVEFTIGDKIADLFNAARIDFDASAIGSINTRVYNAVGSSPLKPLGFNPSYDQGARGPTPRVTPFAVERLSVTFPAFIVGNDAAGTRHFLDENTTNFLEALVQLGARRADLIPQALIGVTVRRLFEENEPSDDNKTDASSLYSAVDNYESVQVVYAGGDQSNYTVSFDVMKRPDRTRIDNYAGPSV